MADRGERVVTALAGLLRRPHPKLNAPAAVPAHRHSARDPQGQIPAGCKLLVSFLTQSIVFATNNHQHFCPKVSSNGVGYVYIVAG
jgi:hypothetical protein